MSEEECGALDLGRCINATCDFPVLFPCADQLADTGAKRCYPRPMCDLYRNVLEAVPAGRAKDVVLFDPRDFDHAVGLNFLEAPVLTRRCR